MIVRVERLEVEHQVSQGRRALFNRSHDIRADVSADEMEIDRAASNAWKKRVTVMQPSSDNFACEDRVIEHKGSDIRCHSCMFAVKILWILLVRC